MKEEKPSTATVQVVRCKECRFGTDEGIEYACDKHSGHKDVLGEDVHYNEWHSGNWFCADGERREE